LGAAPVAAAEASAPVPIVTIYPGDTIRDGMLGERDIANPDARTIVQSRSEVVGKVARRTLLPGNLIPIIAVEDAKLVANGGQVKVVFQEAGLTITTYGAALQAGKLGDFIKVRNLDSGLIISGTVLEDGSVRVSGS
jgi:flagella basal body P-ring formation protein FlgA